MDDTWFNKGTDWVFIMRFLMECLENDKSAQKWPLRIKRKPLYLLRLHPLDLFETRNVNSNEAADFFLRYLSGIAAHQNFGQKANVPISRLRKAEVTPAADARHTASRLCQAQWQCGTFSVSGMRAAEQFLPKHASTSRHVSTATKKKKNVTSSRHRNTYISKFKGKFLISSENGISACPVWVTEINAVWHEFVLVHLQK